MSKELVELKPSVLLKFIDGLLKRYEGKSDYNIYITKDWLLDIKQALQRLEAIDNSNPSEALECLGTIEEFNIYNTNCNTMKDCCNYELNVIKQYILKTQENENARAFGKDIINLNKILKQTIDKPILYVSRYDNKYIVPQELFEEQCDILYIIKKKRINVEKFMYTFVDVEMWNYEQYLSDYKLYGTELLTEKEFELLKKYCGKEGKSK